MTKRLVDLDDIVVDSARAVLGTQTTKETLDVAPPQGIPDLLIAATAARHGVTVLHYDRDFDIVAEVTGQPVAWVVPPSTID